MQRRALMLGLATTVMGIALGGGCTTDVPDGAAGESELVSSVHVLTQHNDVSRTGLNASEKTLTPAVVSSGRFGKVFARDVDGQVYAQPLFVGGVSGKNVVYVATEHNSVYAFDADGHSNTPLWTINLGPSVPAADTQCGDLAPEVGITSTPVVDLSHQTMFVSAKSKENGHYVHRLHALDIATGHERPHSPVEIKATSPGTGAGSVNGQLSFDPLRQLNRPGLLLLNGVVYLAFASHCDVGTYHGWVLGYDATTLEQKGVHVTTPDGDDGGIWLGGVGLAAGAHDLYYVAGNGAYDGTRNFGEAIVRLVPSETGSLSVGTSFAPFGTEELNHDDVDIGSTGALLVPDTNLLVVGDKAGRFFVVKRDQMGGRVQHDTQIVQKFQGTSQAAFGGLAYFDKTLYAWGVSDVLKAYHFNGTKFDTTPKTNGSAHAGSRGAQISVSADGTTNGIVWTVRPGRGGFADGAVQAFDAVDITHELWSSEKNGRDHLGAIAKFAAPTVVAGRVFLGTGSNQLVAYGILGSEASDGGPTPPDADGAPEGGPVRQAPTFTQIFHDWLGPGTPGHCTNCHAGLRGGFKCGTTKTECYAGLVASGLITPSTPRKAVLVEEGASPLVWFGGGMPVDGASANPQARAAVQAWVEAGAKND